MTCSLVWLARYLHAFLPSPSCYRSCLAAFLPACCHSLCLSCFILVSLSAIHACLVPPCLSAVVPIFLSFRLSAFQPSSLRPCLACLLSSCLHPLILTFHFPSCSSPLPRPPSFAVRSVCLVRSVLPPFTHPIPYHPRLVGRLPVSYRMHACINHELS